MIQVLDLLMPLVAVAIDLLKWSTCTEDLWDKPKIWKIPEAVSSLNKALISFYQREDHINISQSSFSLTDWI